MDEVYRQLEQYGVRPSAPRIAIVDYLLRRRIHPDADTIYRAVRKAIPTISRTTVYNTLRLLAVKGMVATLELEPHKTRYDINPGFHAHFVCDRCGAIEDVYIQDCGFVKSNAPLRALTRSVQMIYRGTCAVCASKEMRFS